MTCKQELCSSVIVLSLVFDSKRYKSQIPTPDLNITRTQRGTKVPRRLQHRLLRHTAISRIISPAQAKNIENLLAVSLHLKIKKNQRERCHKPAFAAAFNPRASLSVRVALSPVSHRKRPTVRYSDLNGLQRFVIDRQQSWVYAGQRKKFYTDSKGDRWIYFAKL